MSNKLADNSLTDSKPGPKGVVLESLLKTVMENPNLTHEELGKIHGVSHQAISQRLAPYKDRIQAIKDYWASPGTVLKLKAQEILLAMDSDKIAKASLKEQGTVFGILYDKTRIEQGQSTQNQAIQVNLRVIKEDTPITGEPGAGPQAADQTIDVTLETIDTAE